MSACRAADGNARGALALAALALALAGCSMLRERGPHPATLRSDAPAQIWEYEAGEFPAMCILMYADGTLLFRGGYHFFNPSRWAPHGADGGFAISLGGEAEFPARPAAEEYRRKGRSLVGYDAAARELVYKPAGNDRHIVFGGFYFYRSATCRAA